MENIPAAISRPSGDLEVLYALKRSTVYASSCGSVSLGSVDLARSGKAAAEVLAVAEEACLMLSEGALSGDVPLGFSEAEAVLGCCKLPGKRQRAR